MTATISDLAGTTTLTPLLIEGYQYQRPSRNIFHTVLGANQPANSTKEDVTLQPAGRRAGTLRYLFATEADAQACDALHQTASLVTVSDDDRDIVAMTYTLDGPVTVELDPTTRDAWHVSVRFREVTT